jgi:hypothetical protein
LYLKQAPKKLLKSKRNQSQNNPLENNVKRVPAKSSTLFSGELFWRQLRFGGNCYFPADFFGGSSDLAGTTTTKTDTTTQLYRLIFGGNWLHIIFRRIVLEAAQIWWKQQQKK